MSLNDKTDSIKKSEVKISKLKIKPIPKNDSSVKSDKKTEKPQKKQPKTISKISLESKKNDIYKIYEKRNKILLAGENICLGRSYGDGIGHPCKSKSY